MTGSRALMTARDLADGVLTRLGLRPAYDEDEEMRLAAEYDRARGYARPVRERSKEAHELAEGAPVVRWRPPQRAV